MNLILKKIVNASPSIPQIKRQGFTLLETVLAMSVLAMIIGVVLAITHSSVGLSRSIIEVQMSARHQSSFSDYLKRLFENLPTDAQITLKENEDKELSLEILNPGSQFPAKGGEHVARWLNLRAVKDRDGLTALLLEVSTAHPNESTSEDPVMYQCELIGSLGSLRWEIYNSSTAEWSEEWAPGVGRPTHIAFFYTYPGYAEEHKILFWIPERRNP